MLNFFDRKSKDMTLHNVTAVGPVKTGVETLELHELKKKMLNFWMRSPRLFTTDIDDVLSQPIITVP